MKQGNQTCNKIIESCNELFYKRGFHKTAFSDIVNATGLSKGNITYHFKSKENILKAVVEQRMDKMQKLFDSWEEQNSDAQFLLNCFIDFLLSDKSELSQFGCPNGTLASELGKSSELNKQLSQGIFNMLRLWLTEQFLKLGYTAEQSKDQAMELFTRAQGICVISQVYNDEILFENEIKRLKKQILPL